MCKKATCSACSGVTWFGCGMHIPMVMNGVPEDKWCTCPKPADSPYPPKGSMPACTIL
ncbi:hypothetical protein BZA05DRAFT_341459 [Tricharina praecox]|uniref:uncharacterized protein n=1 Tax=Tricharina praecox TaxID=43433 RepID=UPI0022208266|nr:uncharacterized protein BZA05DRAFT_341459 [Tricharina praecox]KAI5846803.1 hypothetical protein BZA05DRAFT_341459 [Tricharina praecox]